MTIMFYTGHIRIRNHKKPTVKKFTRNQIHEATQAMNTSAMHFSQSQFAWNYPAGNNAAFSPPHVPANDLTNFQQQPNSWVMQGDPATFPAMTSPGLRTPTPASVSSGFEETFKPMHHSLSDPNISPYYQGENNTIFPRGAIVPQIQNTCDAFASKIEFDEKTFLQPTGQQDPVSPSSTSLSDPGTSPYYIHDAYEYCRQNSPGAIYSSSFNTQAKEPYYHTTQNNNPSSPMNSTYMSNQSPVPSVISPCSSISHVAPEYTPMGGHQQGTILAECQMIPPNSQSTDYEFLNDITKVVEQNSRSPYCHSADLPPVSVQQTINEFALVSSALAQQNADQTISNKGMFMPSVEEEFFFTNSLSDNGFMGSNFL